MGSEGTLGVVTEARPKLAGIPVVHLAATVTLEAASQTVAVLMGSGLGPAVPISSYPQMVVFAQQQLDEKKAVGFVFGHAGDGNLHVVVVGDPTDKREWADLETINGSIVHRAVEVGGTCTGEHGIGVGVGKRNFMQLEHGESYALMKQIKSIINPKGLMNPGKFFLLPAPSWRIIVFYSLLLPGLTGQMSD